MAVPMDPRIKKAVFKKSHLKDEWISPMLWFNMFRAARTRRKRIRWESDPKCHYCKRVTILDLKTHRSNPSELLATWDHMTPLCDGGSESPKNTVIACQACNTLKSDIPYEIFVDVVYDEESLKKYKGLVNETKKAREDKRYQKIMAGDLTDSQLKNCLALAYLGFMGEVDLESYINFIEGENAEAA